MGFSGFYRVKYSQPLLEKMSQALIDQNKDLDCGDRVSIIGDLEALNQAGIESTSNLLNIMGAYSNETEYAVLTSLGRVAGSVSHIYKDQKDYGTLC